MTPDQHGNLTQLVQLGLQFLTDQARAALAEIAPAEAAKTDGEASVEDAAPQEEPTQ